MTNEIVIKMTNPNEPPKITILGDRIKGVASLSYTYKTNDAEGKGEHHYIIEYYDENRQTFRESFVSKLGQLEVIDMVLKCDICGEIKPVTYYEHINKCLCIDCEDLPTRLEGSD